MSARPPSPGPPAAERRHCVAAVYGKYGCDFGQLVKSVSENRRPVREGYAPAKVVSCRKYQVFGEPALADISTSRIEWQNWTMPTYMRRLTRMSNEYSRKLDNLKAALALHFPHYNFCRIHRTLQTTPAMPASICDHLWGTTELLLD